MIRLVKNFIRADLRQSNLIFWDWISPLLIVVGFSIFIKDTAYKNFIYPSLITYLIFQSIIFSIPYRIAQYNYDGIVLTIKEEGKIYKFLMSFSFSRFILVSIQICGYVIISIVFFNANYEANVISFVLYYILICIVFISISLVVGLISETETKALGIAQGIYIVSAILSGVFYPLENSPKLMQVISNIFPLKYANDLVSSALTNKDINIVLPLIFLVTLSIICITILYLLTKKPAYKV